MSSLRSNAVEGAHHKKRSLESFQRMKIDKLVSRILVPNKQGAPNQKLFEAWLQIANQQREKLLRWLYEHPSNHKHSPRHKPGKNMAIPWDYFGADASHGRYNYSMHKTLVVDDMAAFMQTANGTFYKKKKLSSNGIDLRYYVYPNGKTAAQDAHVLFAIEVKSFADDVHSMLLHVAIACKESGSHFSRIAHIQRDQLEPHAHVFHWDDRQLPTQECGAYPSLSFMFKIHFLCVEQTQDHRPSSPQIIRDFVAAKVPFASLKACWLRLNHGLQHYFTSMRQSLHFAFLAFVYRRHYFDVLLHVVIGVESDWSRLFFVDAGHFPIAARFRTHDARVQHDYMAFVFMYCSQHSKSPSMAQIEHYLRPFLRAENERVRTRENAMAKLEFRYTVLEAAESRSRQRLLFLEQQKEAIEEEKSSLQGMVDVVVSTAGQEEPLLRVRKNVSRLNVMMQQYWTTQKEATQTTITASISECGEDSFYSFPSPCKSENTKNDTENASIDIDDTPKTIDLSLILDDEDDTSFFEDEEFVTFSDHAQQHYAEGFFLLQYEILYRSLWQATLNVEAAERHCDLKQPIVQDEIDTLSRIAESHRLLIGVTLRIIRLQHDMDLLQTYRTLLLRCASVTAITINTGTEQHDADGDGDGCANVAAALHEFHKCARHAARMMLPSKHVMEPVFAHADNYFYDARNQLLTVDRQFHLFQGFDGIQVAMVDETPLRLCYEALSRKRREMEREHQHAKADLDWRYHNRCAEFRSTASSTSEYADIVRLKQSTMFRFTTAQELQAFRACKLGVKLEKKKLEFENVPNFSIKLYLIPKTHDGFIHLPFKITFAPDMRFVVLYIRWKCVQIADCKIEQSRQYFVSDSSEVQHAHQWLNPEVTFARCCQFEALEFRVEVEILQIGRFDPATQQMAISDHAKFEFVNFASEVTSLKKRELSMLRHAKVNPLLYLCQHRIRKMFYAALMTSADKRQVLVLHLLRMLPKIDRCLVAVALIFTHAKTKASSQSQFVMHYTAATQFVPLTKAQNQMLLATQLNEVRVQIRIHVAKIWERHTSYAFEFQHDGKIVPTGSIGKQVKHLRKSMRATGEKMKQIKEAEKTVVLQEKKMSQKILELLRNVRLSVGKEINVNSEFSPLNTIDEYIAGLENKQETLKIKCEEHVQHDENRNKKRKKKAADVNDNRKAKKRRKNDNQATKRKRTKNKNAN